MIQELEQEQMKSIKELADTSLKISEAKNTLFKLEETETEYLIEREKKAFARIEKLLNDSNDLFNQISVNNDEVKKYITTVDSFAEYLEEVYDKFIKLHQDFVEKNELWEKRIRKQEEFIAEKRKELEIDQKKVQDDEIRLKNYNDELEKTKVLIESRQSILSASYEEEKKLWNRIK